MSMITDSIQILKSGETDQHEKIAKALLLKHLPSYVTDPFIRRDEDEKRICLSVLYDEQKTA